MKKLTNFLGVLAGTLVLVPLAHADLQLSYKLDAGAAVVCNASVTVSPTTSSNCFTGGPTNIGSGVTLFSYSGTGTQAAAFSRLLSSTTEIANNDTVSHTLILWVTDQYFTSPVAPPGFNWASNLQITSVSGIGTVAMSSCLDQGNLQAQTAGVTTFCGTAGSPTLANLTENYNGVTTDPPNTVTRAVNAIATPYSIGERITLTLGAGSAINLITSQILTPVPEPASIVLLGGILLVTGGVIRRKRSQVS